MTVIKVLTFFKAYFKKLPLKNVDYREFTIFGKENFLRDLDHEITNRTIYKRLENQYEIFKKIFNMVLDKHIHIQKKKAKGNHAPFMIKELRKAIMNRSRFKNKI